MDAGTKRLLPVSIVLMMKLSGLGGMALLCWCLSLVLGKNVVSSALLPPRGIPVLLSHRCKAVGDGRPIFIRHRFDHTSYVNNILEPAEDDLRRELAGAMASRQEHVVYLAGDARLPYGDVANVISDIKQDDPSMYVVLLMKGQIDLNGVNWRNEWETCVGNAVEN